MEIIDSKCGKQGKMLGGLYEAYIAIGTLTRIVFSF